MISINKGLIHSKIAGLSNELKSGDFVFLKVISGSGREYQVSLKGVLFPVKSELKLPVGKTVRARIYINKGAYTFRLEDNNQAFDKGLSSNFIMPGKESGEDLRLTSAFLKTGLPLNPELIRLIPVAVRKKAESDDFIARLVTVLLKKGLRPDERGVESLRDYIFGDSKDNSRERSGERGFQRGRDQSRSGSESRAGYRERNSVCNSSDDDILIKEELKSMWSGNNTINPLKLFNHVSQGADHWLILPFNLEGKERSLEGFAAVRILKSRGKPESIFIRCFGEGEDHDFFINWSSSGPNKMRFSTSLAGKKGKEKEKWSNFLEKLQNLGVESDDNKKGRIVFDGFTAEQDPDIRAGVERFG